jgi:Flp pilus assembly protein TadG
MLTLRTCKSALRRFRRSQSGTTAVLFALGVVPTLIAAGAAVDYARYNDAQTRLQAALDAGSLAAAVSSQSTAERIKAGKSAFENNLSANGMDPASVDFNFTVAGQKVSGHVAYELPSAFMHLAGVSRMDVDLSSEVSLPEAGKAEIALVLDYSGSMTEVSGGQVKYVAMKNAAKKMISDLDKASPGKIKVGLVPFSHHVWVTLPAQFVAGKGSLGTWTGCTQDRPYPANLSDAAPDPMKDITKWGQPNAKVHASDGCGAYVPNNLKVAPLTTDTAAIQSQLDVMKPYAWTHIALGAEFGYHLLSAGAPFTEGAASSDKKTRKFMVLLTDGRQTEPAFGPGTTRSVAQGESNLGAICTNAKASGITIITIAFDLEEEATRKMLSDCSTDKSKDFYVAEDSADVAAAFADIKQTITAKVYVSR